MKFTRTVPSDRLMPNGWHKSVPSRPIYLLLTLLGTALLVNLVAVFKYFFYSENSNFWHALLSMIIGGLIGPVVHEMVHVFSWPTKKRLQSTLIGFAPVINYGFIKKLPTAWMTVRSSQKANVYCWATISPFVLMGLGVSLLSARSLGLWGIFLTGIAGANIVGSYNDLCVVIALSKTQAKTIRDEPFGFYWR